MKSKFPIFKSQKELIYLDSAATSQKPAEVIEAVGNFYAKDNATVKRGIYDLSEIATQNYEDARRKVADFINASAAEVAFTKGTTDSINIVAQGWGENNISTGDEIVVSELEHHSNFIPWQQLAKRKGAKFVIVPVSADGTLQASDFEKFITSKTKLVSVSASSNVLNIELDVQKITQVAHAVGAKVLIDAAQYVPHKKIDVKKIGCDFLAFSAHKIFGPTGIGALFVKQDILHEMQPAQFGGGMVFEVGLQDSTFLNDIHKLEAGTPAIAQAVGFAAAIDFVEKNIDFDALQKQESALCKKLIEGLKQIKAIKILGENNYTDVILNGFQDPQNTFGHLVSFTVDGMHAHDVAAYLNQYKICVRAGNHCAQPLHKKLGIDASVRVSFSVYNDFADIDAVLVALRQLLS